MRSFYPSKRNVHRGKEKANKKILIKYAFKIFDFNKQKILIFSVKIFLFAVVFIFFKGHKRHRKSIDKSCYLLFCMRSFYLFIRIESAFIFNFNNPLQNKRAYCFHYPLFYVIKQGILAAFFFCLVS